MNKFSIAKELINIVTMDGNDHEPFICCDMVGQDELFAIQEKLLDLIEKLDSKQAQVRMPYMYSKNK